jgi:hypothetical protein
MVADGNTVLLVLLLSCLQDYIQRLMAEKADIDKRFHGMKDELITRLQNACAQRDEARAQVRHTVELYNYALCSPTCSSTQSPASHMAECLVGQPVAGRCRPYCTHCKKAWPDIAAKGPLSAS